MRTDSAGQDDQLALPLDTLPNFRRLPIWSIACPMTMGWVVEADEVCVVGGQKDNTTAALTIHQFSPKSY